MWRSPTAAVKSSRESSRASAHFRVPRIDDTGPKLAGSNHSQRQLIQGAGAAIGVACCPVCRSRPDATQGRSSRLADPPPGALAPQLPPAPRMSPDALAPLAASPPSPSLRAAVQSAPLVRPPPVMKGDTIGVVAPSYSPLVGWLACSGKALER